MIEECEDCINAESGVCAECCEHIDLEDGHCLDCGEDRTEWLMCAAYDRAKAYKQGD